MKQIAILVRDQMTRSVCGSLTEAEMPNAGKAKANSRDSQNALFQGRGGKIPDQLDLVEQKARCVGLEAVRSEGTGADGRELAGIQVTFVKPNE
jgi:hypothetical protein